MCWLPPLPPGLDHQIKDKQTSLCGWRVNGTVYESCSQQATLLWFRGKACQSTMPRQTSHHMCCTFYLPTESDQTVQQRLRVCLNSVHCVHVSLRHVWVYSTDSVRGRDAGPDGSCGKMNQARTFLVKMKHPSQRAKLVWPRRWPHSLLHLTHIQQWFMVQT